jgi:ABC-type Na+ efflux pump permease subunit
MEFWTVIGAVAIAGIISGIIYTVITSNNKTKQYIAAVNAGITPEKADAEAPSWGGGGLSWDGDYKKQAVEAQRLNAEVIERLTAMEIRLSSIEKTLNDIPG